MPVRYTIALIIAGIVIACLASYAWWNHDIVERAVRADLRLQKKDGRLPPELQEIDIETLDLNDYKIRLPADIMERQDFAWLLARTWFLWAPATILICVGIAAAIHRVRRQQKATQSQS